MDHYKLLEIATYKTLKCILFDIIGSLKKPYFAIKKRCRPCGIMAVAFLPNTA